MTTVEVCEICDIAECSHIKARRASTGGLGPYARTYLWAMSGWRAGPVVLTPPPPSFEGILKQFVKPRQSTLRVRKIRWKGKATGREIQQCLSHMEDIGYRCTTTVIPYWDFPEIITAVTWPESKQ